jgi:hypothetical protein
MITTSFRIEYRAGQVFKIANLADIHFDDPACDEDKLRHDLALMDDNCYIIGNGDIFSAITLGDKRYSKVGDSSQSPAFVSDAVKRMKNILYPYRKRFIGIGIGNHEEKYITKTATDPVDLLCDALSDDTHRVAHLGLQSIINLTFVHAGGGRGRTVQIFKHHGWGQAAQTEGGNITKFEKRIKTWDSPDVFMFGHVHDKDWKELKPKIGVTSRGKYYTSRRFLLITGPYLRTFTDGKYPSYSERQCFQPSALGCNGIKIMIDDEKHIEYWDPTSKM